MVFKQLGENIVNQGYEMQGLLNMHKGVPFKEIIKNCVDYNPTVEYPVNKDNFPGFVANDEY